MATMSIKFTVKGLDISVSSAAEAAALIRELADESSPPRRTPIKARAQRTGQFKSRNRQLPLPTSPQANGFHVAKMASEFLTAIDRGPEGGVDGEAMAKVLGVSHGKGIGSRAAAINILLRQLGFSRTEVYQNDRTSAGRLWKPGPKLDQAITAVKQYQE
jgi:hypothetical protein